MIELHYAPIELNGDIPCIFFESTDTISKWLIKEKNIPNIVFLIAVEIESVRKIDELFIEDSILSIANFVSRYKNFDFESFIVFVQEYASYEEAYEVALDMKEPSPLCYKKDTN